MTNWGLAGPLGPVAVWALGLGLGLAITLLLEFRRPSRFPWLRRSAVVLAWICLALWAWRPYRLAAPTPQRIAWLTEALPDSALSAWLREQQITALWTATPQGNTQLPSTFVPDGWHLPQSTDSLWVLGEGVHPATATLSQPWSYLSKSRLTGQALSGITQIYLPQQAQVGLPMVIQGQAIAEGPSTLLWRSPSGPVDSMAFSGPDTATFRFSTFPVQAGRFLYQLEWRTTTDTVVEPLPLVIAPRQALDILMLSGFPSFEHRTLKNWLGQNGHRVAIRAQLAAERFRTEFINRPRTTLGRVSGALLDKFQVVIIDAPVLEGLSAGELSALQQAVEKGDLGLWVQAAADTEPTSLNARFRSWVYPGGLRRAVDGEENLTGDVYGLEGRFALSVWDQTTAQGGLLLSQTRGLGTVAIHRALDTYRMPLQGKKNLYSAYWATHLNAVAGALRPTETWRAPQALQFAGRPEENTLITERDIPTVRRVGPDSTRVPLAADLYLAGQWRAQWQAPTPGWQGFALTAPAGDTLWTYALPDSTWQTYQRLGRSKAWQLAQQTPSATTATPKSIREPLSAWWFWALAVVCLTFLWVEPKF